MQALRIRTAKGKFLILNTIHMNTIIKTENGENIALNIIDGESIEINLSKKKMILTEDDLKQLTSSIKELENNFDSVVFRWLQVKITNYSKKEMEKTF